MPPTFILSQDQTLQFVSLKLPKQLKSRLIEISLWLPQLMVISRGLLIIHHQSSLDFLEFTKIRRIFMNRLNSYVVKLFHLPFASPICQRPPRHRRHHPPNSNTGELILANQQIIGAHSTPIAIPVNGGYLPAETTLSGIMHSTVKVHVILSPSKKKGKGGGLHADCMGYINIQLRIWGRYRCLTPLTTLPSVCTMVPWVFGFVFLSVHD